MKRMVYWDVNVKPKSEVYIKMIYKNPTIYIENFEDIYKLPKLKIGFSKTNDKCDEEKAKQKIIEDKNTAILMQQEKSRREKEMSKAKLQII